MPKPQSKPPKSIDYSNQGHISFKSFPPYVITELHFCTVTMGEKEALEAVISFIKAGQKTWGSKFVADISMVLEVL